MRKKVYKVSKAEVEILTLLKSHGYEAQAQFKIKGIPYIYDFYLPKLNIILEYNGNYWHANPKIYKTGSMINMPGLGKVLVDYIWDKDRLKHISATKFGYKVVYVWEEEYKKLKWKAIERAIKRILP